MRILRSISKTESKDFKPLIAQGSTEIARRWLKAVEAERHIPSTEGLEKPLLLLDSIPLILDEILCVIESDDSKIEHEQICSAAVHGSERARLHFDVKEVLREYQLLREHVFLYIQERHEQFAGHDAGKLLTIFRRVGLAIDEALRQTINAFVEERTGDLLDLSRTDSLTGLYNHRTFYERLDEELKRARRYESPLSIVFIDLDNFKSVNDTNGHQFGDYLLLKCTELLRRELRQTDVICRYGGDEFGVILPETNRKDAFTLMNRLPDEFAQLGIREGAPSSFSMSFGIGSHPEDDGTVTHLVKAADERMLKSKAKNKKAMPGQYAERV